MALVVMARKAYGLACAVDYPNLAVKVKKQKKQILTAEGAKNCRRVRKEIRIEALPART
jgi:hypothetical protein